MAVSWAFQNVTACDRRAGRSKLRASDSRRRWCHGKAILLSEVYGLLEPGPVVLVTTARKGHANIMTMSWHTMMEFEPPLIGCVISGRNASFDTLKATKQCVINIPTLELAKQVVGVGNCSGRTVDKFAKFGLTPVEAAEVQAPLIKECYASLNARWPIRGW